MSIMGYGRPDCTVHWSESRDGNNYRVRDDDGIWGYEDLRDRDYSWWVDIGIVPATTPWVDGGCGDIQVACCRRDHNCSEENLSTCLADDGIFFPIDADPNAPLHSCDDLTCLGMLNDDCETALTVCENGVPDPDLGYCDNEDALDPGPICSVSAQDCYDESTCVPWDGDAYRCLVPTDNRLATTDGPPSGGECAASGENSFQADVWYEIAAPCAGALVISMCNAALVYDSLLAVFGDHSATPSCPGSSNEDLLVCDDDFCPGSATVSGVQTLVSEHASYLIRVGGWGNVFGLPSVGRSELDIGFLCYPPMPPRPPGLPADAQHLAPKNRYISINATTNEWFGVAYEVTLSSMRRCSGDDRRACIVDGDCPGVCAGNHDLQCLYDAICGSDGPCVPTGPCVEHADVGNVVKYIGTPFTNGCLPLNDCHACSVNGARCDPNALSACNQGVDGSCEPTMWFVHLVDSPIFRAWTEEIIHITDCAIAPVASYEVRSTVDGIVFSEPLTIGTIEKPNVHYADCVGPVSRTCSRDRELCTEDDDCEQSPEPQDCLGNCTLDNEPCKVDADCDDATGPQTCDEKFTPPDGFTSVLDVQAYLIANRGGATAPHTTWVDIHGVVIGADCGGWADCIVPQQVINVADLQIILHGFLGKTYAETPGQENPGDCP